MTDILDVLIAESGKNPKRTLAESAAYLGVRVRMLLYRIEWGDGPPTIKIGKKTRILQSELDKLLPGGRDAYLSRDEAAIKMGISVRKLDYLCKCDCVGQLRIKFWGRVLFPKKQPWK